MNKSKSYIAIAACSFQLPQLEDGRVWIQLTPAGQFKPADGRAMDVPFWYIDHAIAAAVIARAKARGTPRVLDYEHQTLKKEENGQPAPAAGRFYDFEWREGSGLWGLVELTDRARQMITDGEYLYFSPVFSYASDGRVLAFLMGALTNDPAIDGMEPLARRAAATFGHFLSDEEPVMNELLKAIIAALALKEDATQEQAIAALTALKPAIDGSKQVLEQLRQTLGLEPSATGEQIAACASQLKQQQVDPAKYVPIQAVTELQGQVAALTARLNTGELDGLVQSALADGRLMPSMERWARELGAKDMGSLKSFIAQAPSVAALTSLQTSGAPDPANHNLTASELEAAKLTGLSPAEYAKAKGVN
ncbi:phage protease [Pseudomonas sp. F1_0610]